MKYALSLCAIAAGVTALPQGPAPSYGGSSQPHDSSKYGHGQGSSNNGSNGVVPFKFPLANGFPNIDIPSDALNQIQLQAHGTLPNTPLPTSLSDAGATTFQAIAFNELFEVAFFTSLLQNLTSDAFSLGPSQYAKNFIIDALTAVQAQEELHLLGANAILSSAKRTPIQPCQYIFPGVDSFDSAISTASLFTDVVLGTLQSAENTFATNGDDVIRLIASIIGQEGEQNGFYRVLGKKIPSALPFLTGSSGIFAFSALNQIFVVPGTCGNLDAINVPILLPLTVVDPPKATDSDVHFKFPLKSDIATVDIAKVVKNGDYSGLKLVLVNQQNKPIVEDLKDIKVEDGVVSFTAAFPFNENELNGLTIAAVTAGKSDFANPDEVAAASIAGPGLIEIN
ncbi:hypothetical protein CKM354_000503100 [Cercospora kikuchii]|uniref:Sexual development protein n=1 Tax=Cercospora kikuchii TaxID=84275 RepID=A0A9P3CJR0_9PEZI|nr:uncharacterized protein CKM354_000503100 [Cercospora kikuchii]GIZ41735.1 hypothetical protein CKM354_000503100 [Cercospora kikuchii]